MFSNIFRTDGEQHVGQYLRQRRQIGGHLTAHARHRRRFIDLDFQEVAAGELPGRGKQANSHFHVTTSSWTVALNSSATSGIRP